MKVLYFLLSFLGVLSFSLEANDTLLEKPSLNLKQPKRDNLHESLYYRALNKQARQCILHLQKAREAIDAARGSLSLLNIPLPILISRSYEIPNKDIAFISGKTYTIEPVWLQAERDWQSAQEKMLSIESELNPLLNYGGGYAANALRLYYHEMAVLLYDIMHNTENPTEISNAVKFFNEEADRIIIPQITKSQTSYPGCFVCPNQETKEALSEAQEEIFIWNKSQIPVRFKALNPYLHILYAKIDYLEAGLKQEPISAEQAENMNAKIKKATQVLRNIRLNDFHKAA